MKQKKDGHGTKTNMGNNIVIATNSGTGNVENNIEVNTSGWGRPIGEDEKVNINNNNNKFIMDFPTIALQISFM